MPVLSNGHVWKLTEFLENKRFFFNKDKILKSLSEEYIDEAYVTISKWNNYESTPLSISDSYALS